MLEPSTRIDLAKSAEAAAAKTNAGFVSTAADAPAVPGAYVLAILIETALSVNIAGKAAALPPGRYLYCGSAKGARRRESAALKTYAKPEVRLVAHRPDHPPWPRFGRMDCSGRGRVPARRKPLAPADADTRIWQNRLQTLRRPSAGMAGRGVKPVQEARSVFARRNLIS
jgi:hypothetical protein